VSCFWARIIRETAGAVDGELHAGDVLVRLDCDRRVGSAYIRYWRRILARALVATVLGRRWLWVIPVIAMFGCVLPYAALVSALVTNVSPWPLRVIAVRCGVWSLSRHAASIKPHRSSPTYEYEPLGFGWKSGTGCSMLDAKASPRRPRHMHTHNQQGWIQ
jgi:hypothetical protein